MLNLKGNYEFTPESIAALKSETWSRDTRHSLGPDFSEKMTRIQVRLIEGHMPSMDGPTKARALRTLKYLAGEMSAHDVLRM